jgi:hypothetical protein
MAKAPERSGALCFLATRQRMAAPCPPCVLREPFGFNPLFHTHLQHTWPRPELVAKVRQK